MNRTKISIVIPVYNAADFITRCLDALLQQKNAKFLEDYEVIVINDGSTDDLIKKVKPYPVNLVNLPHNVGKIEARKLGRDWVVLDLSYTRKRKPKK